jgi:hypothetical protein
MQPATAPPPRPAVTPPGAETPPRLAFAVTGAEVDPAAAVPSIGLELTVSAPAGVAVRALALQVQVRIDPRRRTYDDATRARLREVFGTPDQWGGSLQSLLWARLALNVPAFTGRAAVTLPLPCSYDFEVAAHKLLAGLRDGAVPLSLLFNGTVFYAGPGGALRTALLPWEDEVRWDLPVALWWRALDRFFPGSAWLRLHRDLFDRLYAYRRERGLPSWDATVESLLDHAAATDDPAQTEDDA